MTSQTKIDRRRWERWSGSRADIVRLAKRMEDLLTAAGLADSDVTVKVDCVTTKVEYASAAEAGDGLPTLDLTRLDTIVLRNRSSITSGLSVVVYFFKTGTLLEVEGSGDEHIKVVGIADDLAAEIDRQGRAVPHRNMVWGGLGVTWAALLGAGQVFRGSTAGLVLSVAPLFPSAAVFWLFGFPGILPQREIVEEGKRSRAARLRGSTLKLVGWALTLGAGAALGVLSTKWLG